jgi:hypothetical protein
MSSLDKKDKMLHPTDYLLKSVLIQSYNGLEVDISNNIFELIIHESMDALCLSGHIVVVDNINLIRHVPLIGNEKLTIVFNTASRKEIKKTFFCYKIDNKKDDETTKKSSLYYIHFISEELIESHKQKISLSFKEMYHHEMVEKIFKNKLKSSKKLTVANTLSKKNLVLPYMSPFEAIDMICSLSRAKEGDPTYIFYEDLDGFYFHPFNLYARKKPDIVYTWYPRNISVSDKPEVYRDLEKDFYRISEYDQDNIFNTIKNIKNGLFASSMLIHDTTYKTIDLVKFAYNNDFFKFNRLNDFGILPEANDTFSKKSDAHFRMYPRQSYTFDKIERNDDLQDIILKRNAYFNQLKNQNISAVVPGDSDRRVGEPVDIRIVSAEPSTKNEPIKYDPYLSGKYIIKRITHMMEKQKYEMRLYLEKDSQELGYPETKTTR